MEENVSLELTYLYMIVIKFLCFQNPVPFYFYGSATFENVSYPCKQHTIAWHKLGNEDCLYLNVYTTHVRVSKRPRPLMPVLVWIHGGSFTEGSSETDIFGSEFILDEVSTLLAVLFRIGKTSLIACKYITGNHSHHIQLSFIIVGILWNKGFAYSC